MPFLRVFGPTLPVAAPKRRQAVQDTVRGPRASGSVSSKVSVLLADRLYLVRVLTVKHRDPQAYVVIAAELVGEPADAVRFIPQ